MGLSKFEPIIISGPSGAGKSELITYIEQHNSQFVEATGMTTRARRKDENDKMDFVSIQQFEQQIVNNNLIEYCIYNGNYYGVSKTEFKKLENQFVIFNVGYSSARVIKNLYNTAKLIYLLPPTSEELWKRFGDRDIERYRLGMEETKNNALYYDYLLISWTNNLEKVYKDFMDIIEENIVSHQKKMTLKLNEKFIKEFYS